MQPHSSSASDWPDGADETGVHRDEDKQRSDVETYEVEQVAVEIVVVRVIERGAVDHGGHRHRRQAHLHTTRIYHVHHAAVEEPSHHTKPTHQLPIRWHTPAVTTAGIYLPPSLSLLVTL